MLAFSRVFIAASAIIVAQSVPALASGKNPTTITSEAACLAAIKDTGEARAGNPVLGPKAAKAFDEILALAAQRCKDGEFQHADDLLIIARGMVASE